MLEGANAPSTFLCNCLAQLNCQNDNRCQETLLADDLRSLRGCLTARSIRSRATRTVLWRGTPASSRETPTNGINPRASLASPAFWVLHSPFRSLFPFPFPATIHPLYN